LLCSGVERTASMTFEELLDADALQPQTTAALRDRYLPR
jgi:hypothetical protein